MVAAVAVAIRALSLPSISSSSNKQKLPHSNTYDERENQIYNDNSQ